MARNHYTVEGPRVASTSMPERAPESFNAWQEELQWERDLERTLPPYSHRTARTTHASFPAAAL